MTTTIINCVDCFRPCVGVYHYIYHGIGLSIGPLCEVCYAKRQSDQPTIITQNNSKEEN